MYVRYVTHVIYLCPHIVLWHFHVFDQVAESEAGEKEEEKPEEPEPPATPAKEAEKGKLAFFGNYLYLQHYTFHLHNLCSDREVIITFKICTERDKKRRKYVVHTHACAHTHTLCLPLNNETVLPISYWQWGTHACVQPRTNFVKVIFLFKLLLYEGMKFATIGSMCYCGRPMVSCASLVWTLNFISTA